ncbi:hypothetical protein [Nocardia sp. MW-W600-9]
MLWRHRLPAHDRQRLASFGYRGAHNLWGGLFLLLFFVIFGRFVWGLLNVVAEFTWDAYTLRRIKREITALPDEVTAPHGKFEAS